MSDDDNTTMTGPTFAETLESLRQIINNGTATLAAGGLLDEQVSEGLSWALQTAVARSYAAFQADPPSFSMEYSYDDEEVVTVVPLLLEGTVLQRRNPVVFASPFVVAPFQQEEGEEEATEAHLLIVCAVAAFNLGLAMHAQSYNVTSTNKNQDDLLKRAKDFYIQAHDLIDRLHVLVPDGTWIQVFLAVCNNVAEINAQLNLPVETQEWQESLQQCFWTVPPMIKSPVYRHFNDASVCYGMAFEPIPEVNKKK